MSLRFFLNHLDFRHLLDEAALDSHSASLGKATPAKTSPLPGRVLASRLTDSGWQRKLCQHRVQEVFQDTPSHWAKLSALGTAATRAKSCSAHGSCTPVAEAQSVLPQGLGLALPEGSFFGQQEQKGHQNQGEERGLIFTAAALVWDLPGLFWSTLQGTHQALSRREFVPALWALCQDSCYKPWVQGPAQHPHAQLAEYPWASLPAPCPAPSGS